MQEGETETNSFRFDEQIAGHNQKSAKLNHPAAPAAYLNNEMHGRKGGRLSRALASRSPVPADHYRSGSEMEQFIGASKLGRLMSDDKSEYLGFFSPPRSFKGRQSCHSDSLAGT